MRAYDIPNLAFSFKGKLLGILNASALSHNWHYGTLSLISYQLSDYMGTAPNLKGDSEF